MNLKEVLLKLFEITGNVQDSAIFLKNFKSTSPERFAIVKVGSDVIIENAEHLFYDLKILYKLELFPVIVIDKKSLEYLSIFYINLYKKLYNHTDEPELKLETITFSEDYKNQILLAIANKKIPIVVIETENFQNEVFSFLKILLRELNSNKLILLESPGGLKKRDEHKAINIINLAYDYDKIIPYLDNNAQKILTNSKKLIEELPNPFLSIAITSAISLFKELFTVKGSGTLIKRGSIIEIIENNQGIDKKRLKKLLESSFKKSIHPEFLEQDFNLVLLETHYRGAAIIKKLPQGFMLSKFAVDEIARGEGIGRDIWEVMRKNLNTIFWRAKPSNPINKWYMKECQGMYKFENWYIYWINLEPSLVQEVSHFLTSHPEDFLEESL